MYIFFFGLSMFACQVVHIKAQVIPVCRPDQVDQVSTPCVRYRRFGFCTSTSDSIRQLMVNNCPVTCGFCVEPPPPTTPAPTPPAPTLTPVPSTLPITTQQRTTVRLTTQQPTTAAPTTQQQTTAAPTTQQQTTAVPTTQQQTTARQTTQQQTTAGPTTTGLPVPPPPTTPVPTIPVCRRDQVDISSFQCAQYQSFGFCTSTTDSIRQFVETNCPVTCGFCRGKFCIS
ncbi:unnamed protein product [Porites lobata]|uniref:ShKT domain-containing protein n=1 Tax=Porites lobata TaxID=104759 RepID=A0ABN8NWK7_9CNID|nr:unnamed protein product [Porites lobata]